MGPHVRNPSISVACGRDLGHKIRWTATRQLGDRWSTDYDRHPTNPEIPNSDVPIRKIRSRTFWPFRPIYTQGSITNVTKPHKFGTLTRPGTLLGQAANWFILGEKIHRYLIACPHSFTRPLNFKSSKQVACDFFVRSCDTSTIAAIFAHYKEGKAITFSHIYFFLVFQTGVD